MSSAALRAVALRLMTHRASSSAPSASILLSPCLPLRLTVTLFHATAFRMTAAAMLIAEVQEPDGDDGTCAPEHEFTAVPAKRVPVARVLRRATL
jgi:hypothetical protein